MKTLVLRNEIYAATHRWPVIVASFLVGSLIGILVAYIWPSPYRATLELAVGLNLYRSIDDGYIAEIAEVPFRNADDYKYWQMQQLNALVLSDGYLNETLSRLSEADAYWQEVTVEDLRNMFRVYWRNAGEWRLTAEVKERHYAKDAVENWRDVILEKTNKSITNARQIYLIDLQLQGIRDDLFHAQSRLEQLLQIEVALDQWYEEADDSSRNEVLDLSERWWLISLASQAAGMNLGWQSLLDSFPSPNAAIAEYLPWVEQVLIAVEAESESIAIQVEESEQQIEVLLYEWENALQGGDGLAATLTIEQLSDKEPSIRPLRPTFTSALVGGLLGLLIWGVITLLRIHRGLES
jgi:hypothetical protein